MIRTAPRFAVVGLTGLLVNTLMLQLFYGVVGLPLLAASALAAEFAILSNYYLNDRWTFGRDRPSIVRFAKFNLSSILALAVSVAVLSALVACGVHYLVANLVGVAVGSGLNLLIGSGWVWVGRAA
jgi:putative flippase GtrA